MALCAAARVGSRHQRDRRVCPACGGSCGRARRGDIGIKTQDATLAARIDVQTHNVPDLNRRLGQIDSAIKEAASVARPTPPCRPSKASAARVPGLWRSGSVRRGPLWAALQAERAGVAAKGREIDTEAAPIRYVAAIFGVADQETAIRWLIALMVLRCDAPAIATVAAALAPQHSSSAQNRSPTDRSALVEFAPTSRSTPGKS